MSAQPSPVRSPAFRQNLRVFLLKNPHVTLAQVGRKLNLSRQRVSQLTGPLNRPNCVTSSRPAPKLEQARALLPTLTERVHTGEPASRAAQELGISIQQAYRLGFRVLDPRVRPAHGTQARLTHGCRCWRCRSAAGLSQPRGPRMSAAQQAEAIDLLAWRDPDMDTPLTQAAIGKLVGIRQSAVSRIAKAIEDSTK